MKIYRIITAALAIICYGMVAPPAQAITLKEEKKLGSEFLKYVRRHLQMVDDPMILGYVNEVGQKVLSSMPAQPYTYHFYVVKEQVPNAFAVPAGYVFINSGLLAVMESEDELAGILGHEIAHVACRHISDRIEQSKKINLATMAGVVAGIFLGAATGETAAMQALTIGSMAAGQTAALKYSRQDEAQADDVGIKYLVKAGYDPRGLVSVLIKIRQHQWFGSDQIPTYMMTHPATESRLAWIDNWMAMNPEAAKPAKSDRHPSKTIFKRISARLTALYDDPDDAVNHFKTALAKKPNDADLVYGLGLALDRSGNRADAITQLKKALSHNAFDPYILGDLGRIYFNQGRHLEAKSTLQGALSLPTSNPQARFYLARTYLALEQLDHAALNFEQLLDSYADYHEAYYYLGGVYTKLKRMHEAHFNLGVFHYKKGDFPTARFHLVRANNKISDPVKQKAIDGYLKIINRRLKEIEKSRE